MLITRDADVRLYTGMQNTDAFRTLFEYLLPKAKNMNYWKGDKQTEAEKPKRYSDVTIDQGLLCSSLGQVPGQFLCCRMAQIIMQLPNGGLFGLS